MELAELQRELYAISHSRGADKEKGFKELLNSLIYEDKGLWVAFKDSQLYLAPHADEEDKQYLRLFSHKELAEAYTKVNKEIDVVHLSSIEFMQATKAALLAGGNAWLLNENDNWACISLAGILEAFISNVLKDDTMYDDKVAELISFIQKFKNNTVNKVSAVFDAADKTKWLIDDNAASICDGNSEAVIPYKVTSVLHPLTPQMLYDIPCEKVNIYSDGEETEYDTKDVCAVLAACGYAPQSAASIPDKYIDVRPEVDDILLNWKVTDLSLTFKSLFQPINISNTEGPDAHNSTCSDDRENNNVTNVENALAEHVMVPELSSEELSDSNTSNTLNAITGKTKVAMYGAFSKARDRAKVLAEKGKEAIRSRHRKEQRPSEEEAPGLEEDVEKKKTRHMIIAVSAVVLAIILCVSIVLIVQHTRYRRNFIQFCEYLDDRDYGNAYAVYKANDFYEDGTSYLTKALDSLVLSYARNEISAEELGASITALSQFPGITQNISVAKLTATKLEESKNAYVRGKNTSDVFTRLSNWQQVIDLDEVNYLAVQQNIADNRNTYELVIEEEIDYYSTRNRDFAQRRWQVLQYWYPDSEAVEKWRSEYETDASDILSSYPVTVKEISIKQERNGYWSLRIDWSNISAKTIASIRFSLVALDSKGNIVTSTDSHGSWTIFDARDPGPFEPGQGHDTSTYVWYNAWFGTEIAKVNLTGIYITYKDETTASFSQEVDLLRIQNIKQE